MSKFKVGDMVRTSIKLAEKHGDMFGIGAEFWEDSKTRKVLAVYDDNTVQTDYKLSGTDFFWPEYALVSAEPREFIVIRRAGSDVIASHKRVDEIVKTAKAKCAPSDEFNFETGAKLAFDRLMGREEPKSQPAPEPLYAQYFKHSVEAEKRSSMKIGDRVVHPIHGSGTVVGFERDNMGDWVWYMEDGDNSRPYPGSEGVLKKIAPEPKYYTGRVVCISGEYGIGKIYTVVNGRFTDKTMNIALPYKSVEHMNDTFLFGKVAEVKE